MKSDKVGIGIIGMGGMGAWAHLPGYNQIPNDAKVEALCDTDPSRLERFKSNGARLYAKYEELLADPAVDAVDICLPHNLHGKVALAAINAGKHVIIEKPFTLTLEEADSVIAAAKNAKVKLMVAENARFVDAYEVTRQLLDQEVIGQICYAMAYIGGDELIELRDPNNWFGKSTIAGGGVVMDSAVHSFYLFKWMVGDMTQVSAYTTKFLAENLPSDVETNGIGIFKFESGALGHFANTGTTGHPWTERLTLIGEYGSIDVDMLAEHPVKVFSSKRRSADRSKWFTYYGDVSFEEPFIRHSALDWKNDSIHKEVKHFVSCIKEDKQPLVSGEDGKDAVDIALKVYESAKTGRPVDL